MQQLSSYISSTQRDHENIGELLEPRIRDLVEISVQKWGFWNKCNICTPVTRWEARKEKNALSPEPCTSIWEKRSTGFLRISALQRTSDGQWRCRKIEKVWLELWLASQSYLYRKWELIREVLCLLSSSFRSCIPSRADYWLRIQQALRTRKIFYLLLLQMLK